MARYGDNHKGGRPLGSVGTHTLMAQETKKKLIEMYKLASEHINVKLIEKALDGDILAIKELHDRVWGKAFQTGELDVNHNVVPLNLTDDQYRQAIAAASATAKPANLGSGGSSDQSST